MNPAVSEAHWPKCSAGKSCNSALGSEHGLNSLIDARGSWGPAAESQADSTTLG